MGDIPLRAPSTRFILDAAASSRLSKRADAAMLKYLLDTHMAIYVIKRRPI
jgi:hypothetical protein